MKNENETLEALFERYRESCPEVEPSANFMPSLWERIEAKSYFWFGFERLGRKAMTASAALCLVLLALNWISGSRPLALSYADALMADHSAEKTYYTEAIRNAPSEEDTKTPGIRQ